MRALFLVLLTTVCALPARAATILERTIDVRIEGSSALVRTRLHVAIEEPGDIDDWSEYRILLDDDLELVDCTAQVRDGGGRVIDRIRDREHEREDSAGYGLYSSAWYRVIQFPRLQTGQRLFIDVEKRHSPPFPALVFFLQRAEPQDALRIRVTGGGGTLRHTLHAAGDLVALTELDDGFELAGTGIDRYDPPDFAGDSAAARPGLRLAWGEIATWPGVGAWYTELISGVPRGSAKVRALAASLVKEEHSPRDKLEALAAHVRNQVRYEAVQIGPGGWIPSPAEEVVERGWGDCKDKAELLSQLLAAAGIRSHLALIRLGLFTRIDESFPSHLLFNHCIVAVPADQVETRPGDPVADGYLLIDATMDRGGPLWLASGCQGHHALVAAAGSSRLVTAPIPVEEEGRLLVVQGTVDEQGTLTGLVALRLFGGRALSWLRDMDSEAPVRIEESVRRTMQHLLPGATFSQVLWSDLTEEVPAIQLQARAELPRMVRGKAGRRWFRPALLAALPGPGDLEERSEPVVLRPGVHISRWLLQLPEGWCPPDVGESDTATGLGEITYQVRIEEGGKLAIERRLHMPTRWFASDQLETLGELVQAERRTNSKRVRLRCTAADGESQ